jgi:hypothetical protein
MSGGHALPAGTVNRSRFAGRAGQIGLKTRFLPAEMPLADL